ncbi:hypothetical protein CAEBREN_31946 [Caenorhabditis brenneri]|uniref:Acyltransferase 3 domain-containing protein n=1 Tax=Caenorhabditis brenneri TaxID=135651 RepID=G0NK21_CAEBE|nr:hypothetical protein CAEBREN_31946 [Caenorhabditis brenneri]
MNWLPVPLGVWAATPCDETHITKLLEFAREYFLRETTKVESVHCSNGDNEFWRFGKVNFLWPFVLFVFFSILALLAVGTLTDKMNREGLIKKTLQDIILSKFCFSETFHVNRSPTGSVSDRESCGNESFEDENGSIANSSVNRLNAPSIALTYRSLSAISFSNSLLISILSSFSVRNSLNYLFRNSTRDVKLVNLFRVCSSFWVIFSHTCLFSLNFTDTIRDVARKGESVVGWRNFMLNSSLAVDTFLFLSACVATYSIRKKLMFRGSDASFSIIKCAFLLFHRCLRILPALSLYLVFMAFVYNYLGDGPFWNTEGNRESYDILVRDFYSGMFGSQCEFSSLWPHFTFLANFFPSTCVPWLWYISLDFQLYLVSFCIMFVVEYEFQTLPIIIFFVSRFRFGWLLIIFLCILSLTYRSLMFSIHTLPANMFVEMLSGKFEKAELSFKLLYTSPLSRCPPFLIGILTGWYICQIRYLGTLRTITTLGLKVLAVTLLVFALFGPFITSDYFIYPHAVINRTIWAIGLAILVVLAQNGYNFGVFKVFSGQALVVLSRLSFGVYLSHEPILLYYLNTLRQAMSPSSFGYFMFITISIYVLSLIAAFFIAIAIEVPLLTLERKLFMTTREMNGDVMRERMERHVSFGETEIEKYEIKNEEDDGDGDDGTDDMDPNEKTRQWLETGQLCAQRSDLDVIGKKQKLIRTVKEEKKEGEEEETSTSC